MPKVPKVKGCAEGKWKPDTGFGMMLDTGWAKLIAEGREGDVPEHAQPTHPGEPGHQSMSLL